MAASDIEMSLASDIGELKGQMGLVLSGQSDINTKLDKISTEGTAVCKANSGRIKNLENVGRKSHGVAGLVGGGSVGLAGGIAFIIVKVIEHFSTGG